MEGLKSKCTTVQINFSSLFYIALSNPRSPSSQHSVRESIASVVEELAGLGGSNFEDNILEAVRKGRVSLFYVTRLAIVV